MLLPSNGVGGWDYVCVRDGAVHTVHSQRVLMESYGTSVPRQRVMHRGEGREEGDDRSLSLTGLTYIPLCLIERGRE